MVTALSSYQRLKKNRGPLATALIQILKNLRQYSHAVDVLVQCDPTIAGLVWGSVRLLLQVIPRDTGIERSFLMFQVGEEEEWASRMAGEGVLEIIRHAGRWEQVSAISELLDSTRLQKALVALYVTVLDFLLSSARWLGRGALGKGLIRYLAAVAENYQYS